MILLAEVIQLDWWDLCLSAGMVLVVGVLSLLLRLGIEKRLAVASVRTVVQLLLIGYVLMWVFRHHWSIAPLAVVMVLVAGYDAVKRSGRAFAGMYWLALLSLIASAFLTTIFVTGVIVSARPWYLPQYFVPLLGMVLGNSMTGISLCMDHLLEHLAARRAEVEVELALGATRWEAARQPLQQAVRRGLIPLINRMMVTGIVSLPGMMSGQILSGEDPNNAVRYQVMVMFMIAAATALGSISVALLVCRRLFNRRHQLRADLLTKRT